MKHTLKNLVALVIIMSILMTIAIVPTNAAATTKTIYFTNSYGWTKVYAYAWGGSDGNSLGGWPGSLMKLVDVNEYGQDIYSINVSTLSTKIIFSNGSVQSADTTISSTFNGYYPNSSSNKFSCGTFNYVPTVFYVAGSSGLCSVEWNPKYDAMTYNEDGSRSITFTDVAAGAYEFKVTDGTWNHAWPSSNKSITLTEKSDVTITFRPDTKVISVDTHSHTWVDADCDTAKTCSGCGMTDGNPNGHSYNKVVTDATCLAGGYTTYTCSSCGDNYIADRTPILAHNYKNGVCSGCGDVRMVTIGNSNFASIDEAIAAAGDNDVITLQADINYDNVLYLMNNAKIDLNGHTLTALGVSVFSDGGSIFDSSETKGLLAVPNGYLIMKGSENDMLPIWNEDGTGYLFVEVEAKNMMSAIDEDSFKIVFRPEFDSVNAADFFADGAPDNGITLSVQIKCIKDEQVVETLGFTAPESTIQSIYTNNKAMSLTVNGAGTNFDSYEIAILLTSDTGVVFSQVIGSFSQGIYTPVA